MISVRQSRRLFLLNSVKKSEQGMNTKYLLINRAGHVC